MDRKEKCICLDGLRAVAVIQVILFHHRLEGESIAARNVVYAILSPTRFGFSGVHLFLVLSGFCLTHSLIRRSRSDRFPTLLGFLSARWWRIAPPYFAALAVYLAVILACQWSGVSHRFAGQVNVRQIVTHLTFVHALADDTSEAISPPFWSLSLEFQLYLAFPLLFFFARRFGPIRTLSGALAIGLAWRIGMAGLAPQSWTLQRGFFLGRSTEFVLGMAAAFLYSRADRPRLLTWPPARVAAFGCGGLASGVLLASRGMTPWEDYAFGIGYVAILVAVLASAESGGLLGRLASIGPLARIGTISYSLYLTHSLVLDWEYAAYRRIVARPGPWSDFGLVVAMLAAVLAVGWSFHRLIERRFLRSIDASRPVPEASADPRRSAIPGPAAVRLAFRF